MTSPGRCRYQWGAGLSHPRRPSAPAASNPRRVLWSGTQRAGEGPGTPPSLAAGHTHKHTCTHTHAHNQAHTHKHSRTQAHTHKHTHVRTCTHTQTHIHSLTNTHISKHAHTSTHAQTQAHAHSCPPAHKYPYAPTQRHTHTTQWWWGNAVQNKKNTGCTSSGLESGQIQKIINSLKWIAGNGTCD